MKNRFSPLINKEKNVFFSERIIPGALGPEEAVSFPVDFPSPGPAGFFQAHRGGGAGRHIFSGWTLQYSDFTDRSNKPNQQPALPLLTAEALLRPVN